MLELYLVPPSKLKLVEAQTDYQTQNPFLKNNSLANNTRQWFALKLRPCSNSKLQLVKTQTTDLILKPNFIYSF